MYSMFAEQKSRSGHSQELDMSTPHVLKTYKLAKAFGSFVAVNKIDLEVFKGDVFGFLGPNGSGKTTTIRMLLGLIRPTSGTVEMFGLDTVTHRSALLARVGAIIEWPVFYPYLSGRDNLRIFATVSGIQRGQVTEKRIDEILELIDLRDAARRIYRTYSLGMKQRLGLGAALLTDPELILLDEPTNGLDPAGVHEMRQLILRLATQGKTIFLSSHLLYEIQQVCNRVAILQKGNLLRQGAVRDLLDQETGVIVRMDSLEETQRAYTLLQQAVQRHEVEWISQVIIDNNTEQQGPRLQISAPVQYASEITARLAQHNLFVAELRPMQTSLEEFYLELTGNAALTQKP